jgi:protein-S-isoprenylcysteine O-methyltransferase Ste14
MVIVILQVVGGLAFVAATVVLGAYLRRHPTKEDAEKASRVSHGFYWLALALPSIVAVFYPGLTRFDEILGIPSLRLRSVTAALGVVAVLAGVYLMFAAIGSLRRLGEGTNAFVLTKKVVTSTVYARSRNPMSLGYYLLCLGLGLLAGSTYVLIATLFGIVPMHMFNLIYFEEYELALRLGPSYLLYKERVPLLFPKLGPLESPTADTQ